MHALEFEDALTVLHTRNPSDLPAHNYRFVEACANTLQTKPGVSSKALTRRLAGDVTTSTQ